MAQQFGLLVDTTLGGIAMALVSLPDYRICAQHLDLEQKSGTAKLSEYFAECLASQNASVSQLECSLTSNGPGSFTGIKVGLAFALGLQKGRPQLSFWTCSSFRLLAHQFLANKPAASALLLPATRTRAAAAILGPDGGVEVLDFNIENEDLLKRLALENMYFLAPSPMLEFMLNSGSVKQVELLQLDEVMPLVMQLLCAELKRRREAHDASDELEPFYLRLSSAEEKIAAR